MGGIGGEGGKCPPLFFIPKNSSFRLLILLGANNKFGVTIGGGINWGEGGKCPPILLYTYEQFIPATDFIRS